MSEILGSPISRHDINVIRNQLTQAQVSLIGVDEVHLSTRRIREPFRLFGVPVLLNDSLDINEAMFITQGREPFRFDLENAS